MAFFACARTLAHRFLAAFRIFALPASERTRFFVYQQRVSIPGGRLLFCLRFPNYFMAFFACARTLAPRFLAAFAIFALPASERTRFFVYQQRVSIPGGRLLFCLRFPNYFMAFFACARTLAHRFLAAFAIFALPASERTRFFVPDSSRPTEFPNAFPAARTPSNCFCNLPNCFSSFRSSRLIAAR